jgi:hypothetical protein
MLYNVKSVKVEPNLTSFKMTYVIIFLLDVMYFKLFNI